MNWFRHDTDATQDAKIKKLLIRHGAQGYAVYFHCLELIAAEISESNLTFELEHDSEIIADNLHIRGTADRSGIDIVQEIMRTIVELRLFEESKGHIFCFKLLKRLDTSMTSNSRFRELIRSAKAENHDTVMTHHDTVMIPSCKNRIEKNRREENTGADAPDLPEEKQKRKPDNRETPVEADRLASTLLELHQAIDAGYAVTDGRLKAWAADIDKLHRIDGRTWEQIESVMRWAKADSFWQSNVIAGKTLRSQFTKLLIQMQNRPRQPEKPPERKIVAWQPPDYMRELERKLNSEG
jgi:hypothetical protein